MSDQDRTIQDEYNDLCGEYVDLLNLTQDLVESLKGMIEANKCKELPIPYWVVNRERKALDLIKKAVEVK